jgi:hypothetical protein
VWTREVVECLKEDHATSQLRAVFAEAPALSCQRSQGMTQGQVETLNQTSADLQSQGGQPGCPTPDALTQRVQAATFFLLALRVIVWVDFDGFTGAAAYR